MSRDHFGNIWEEKIDGPKDYWRGHQQQQREREEQANKGAAEYENEKDKKAAYTANLLRDAILKYGKQNNKNFADNRDGTMDWEKKDFVRPIFNILWEDEDIQSLLMVLAKPVPKGDLGTEEDYRAKLEEVVFKRCSELDKA